jgi:hypothetical protein
MKTNRNLGPLSESALRKIVSSSLKKVLSEDIKGRYMSYDPSASGFDDDFANTSNIQNDNEEFINMLNKALTAVAQARDYARVNGDGSWYTFLNSVIGEIRHRASMDM